MIFTAARPLTRTLLASGTIRSTSSAAIPRRAYHRLLSSSSLSTHSHPLQFSSAEHTAHSKCQHAHPDHQNPYLATRMSSSNEKPEASVKQREGPEDWKYREPYRIHTNEDFHSLYEGSCHCGRVQYSLSREKPLASKFCHCTTCQRLHGAFVPRSNMPPASSQCTSLIPHIQAPASSGPPSSTSPTSTSATATTTSSGTTRPRRRAGTSCPARSRVATAAHPLWTRAAT